MISTRGRYALRVMVDLAEHQEDGYIPLKEVALRQQLSEKYLESILKVLVQHQLLEGLRGKGGGYRLTKSPQDIRIGEILEYLEGSLAPVACLKDQATPCDYETNCRTLPMWQNFYHLVRDFFSGISLADLMPENTPAIPELSTL